MLGLFGEIRICILYLPCRLNLQKAKKKIPDNDSQCSTLPSNGATHIQFFYFSFSMRHIIVHYYVIYALQFL